MRTLMQAVHEMQVVDGYSTRRVHHVFQYCTKHCSCVLFTEMAFCEATKMQSELPLLCTMKGHSAQRINCVSPAESCRYMYERHEVYYTSAHNGTNDSSMKPNRFSGRVAAALWILQKCNVHLVGILSRNSGAFCTSRFVHSAIAHCSATKLRDTSRDVTKVSQRHRVHFKCPEQR